MSRDYRLYIDDIIEAIRRIKEFTNRMEFDAFKADIKTQDKVLPPGSWVQSYSKVFSRLTAASCSR
jgi:hypothetical protein